MGYLRSGSIVPNSHMTTPSCKGNLGGFPLMHCLVPALPLNDCERLGKLLNLSGPIFFPLKWYNRSVGQITLGSIS